MISIEKEDDEESLVTFKFQFPNPELRELYRNIFTPDYFRVLGLHVPKVAGWGWGGGGEEEEKDKIPPFPYNIFHRFSNMFETNNPLFRYNAKDLMNNEEEEKKEDMVFNLETAEKLEKEKQEEYEKAQEKEKQIKEEKNKKEKEEKERLDEETKQALVWELEISKHWGSPILTESEYREMKLLSNHSNDLEKDENGLTTPESDHLAKMDQIQKNRKEVYKKHMILEKVQYNQSPVFYILPSKNSYYIRLSFAFN